MIILTVSLSGYSQGITIDKKAGKIYINAPQGDLKMVVQYQKGCFVQSLNIKGANVLSSSGAYTGIRTKEDEYRSQYNVTTPEVLLKDSSVSIKGIALTSHAGKSEIKATENWTFTLRDGKLFWKIQRSYGKDLRVEDMAFPAWNFKNMAVWKGGILNNGGIIWCKYLIDSNDTYGVHTGGVTYWNEKSGDGLSIQPVNNYLQSEAAHIATKFTHRPTHAFSAVNLVSGKSLQQRYRLDRFVHGKADVFAPFSVSKGTVSVTYGIEYEDYFDAYSRGDLKGIDAGAIRELLNTTARYGVVDDSIVGGNGWLTNWKCLHEPFFGQMALAIDDTAYNKNLEATLDREMKLAIQPDGRVLSRWHNEPGDEIPGTYNAKTGYYEAKWGYTIDAQTGYVINVADLFNLTGNAKWLKAHQESCEKALEWLIRRDENHNGIFEMKNKNIADGTCSDWLDIVWASYENAFVNAQMYGALIKWADCEALLNNPEGARRYRQIAGRLKNAFNKPVDQGGFWMPEKQQFIYWRDQDGSVHGDNLVTPVQFAAIAFGVCDDPHRIAAILNQIQTRMLKESLFHWPLCFDSYRREEVSEGNWPFPRYENGDLFLTWGYLGVTSYAGYNKELALTYIQKLLEQYNRDGLSFQRYDRKSQQGQGDDILAGNATSIIALYSAIYGIQPRWNRLTIDPHLPSTLNGTAFSYMLRGIKYQIKLSEGRYQVQSGQSTVSANRAFGVSNELNNTLRIYPGDQDSCFVEVPSDTKAGTQLEMIHWDQRIIDLNVHCPVNASLIFKGLPLGSGYQVLINGKKIKAQILGSGALLLTKMPSDKVRINIRVLP